MLLPVIISIIIFSCYILIIFLFFVGLLRIKGTEATISASLPEVTVVVPFRDDLVHLPGIIADLLAQNYSGHHFNVLLINDHSTDGSKEVAISLINDRADFKCMDLPHGREGKKEAIALALSRVKSSWILQTDADCRVGPGFVSSHMHFLAAYPSDLVAGLVTTGKGRGGFLEAFERLDLLALTGSAAGSFSLGRAMMCSGANLLYSRELYRETRKFDPVGKSRSGDDMFLLIGARKLKRRVAFNPDRDCMVMTAPVGSVAGLIRQRIRWGAKSVYYRKTDIQFLAVLVAAVNLVIFFTPLWMIVRPESCVWLLSGIGSKMLVDFFILAAASGKTGQRRTLWWFMPVALIYPGTMAVVIAGSFTNRPVWKGRKV